MKKLVSFALNFIAICSLVVSMLYLAEDNRNEIMAIYSLGLAIFAQIASWDMFFWDRIKK